MTTRSRTAADRPGPRLVLDDIDQAKSGDQELLVAAVFSCIVVVLAVFATHRLQANRDDGDSTCATWPIRRWGTGSDAYRR